MYDKIILFCPAGRQNIMDVQLKYIVKLLDLDMIYEYHIWDCSWSTEDSNYLKTLDNLHPKIKIKYSPFTNSTRASETSSKQFGYMYSDYYKYEDFSDYILIKLDDDICFIDIPNFIKFIDGRKNSTALLYSANVINNNCGALHNFDAIHTNFIQDYKNILMKNTVKDVETHPLGKTVSINFVAILGMDLKYINEEFSNGLGGNDEWRLCNDMANKLIRKNEICLYMTVVHYAFGGHINSKYIDKYIEIYETLHK